MRIKFTVTMQGFRATAKGGDKEIDSVFKPLLPSVETEFRAIKSTVQNVLSDATAFPVQIGSNGKSFLKVGDWYVTDLQSTRDGLMRLNTLGLLRSDRTIELRQYAQTKAYAEVVARAADAGCRAFRTPTAELSVSLAVRPDEEQQLFDTIPSDIIGKIVMTHELPIELAPLKAVAENATEYLQDLIRSIKGTGKLGSTRDWFRKAVELLSRESRIVAHSLIMTTKDAQEVKERLLSSLAKAIEILAKAQDDWSKWTVVQWADDDHPELDINKSAGFALYDERPAPINSEVNVNHITVDEDFDSI